MTYLLVVNGVFWESTRNHTEAFRWLNEWEALGHSAGLRFVRDDDEEAFLWLVPEEAMTAMAAA